MILASASPSRAALLRAAGLSFEIEAADLDETAIRAVLHADDKCPDPGDVAEVLARAKAETISAKNPEATVIGADQILTLEGEIYEKPPDMDAARRNLLKLKGRTHHLHACVCVARNGQGVWSHGEAAHLTMRDFSAEFLGAYLAAEGDTVLDSVGAYKLESRGVQLFSEIKGDYFTVLGLPLVALLNYLRNEGALQV
jgi:septum formation protein